MKSFLVGSVTSAFMFLLVLARIAWQHRAVALGSGAWSQFTIHNWMFWAMILFAFGSGFFFTAYFSH